LVENFDCAPSTLPGSVLGGIIDPGLPNNPVTDDTFIFVPYCTQDLHWGAGNNVTYHPDGRVEVNEGADILVYDEGLETTLSAVNPSDSRVNTSETLWHNGMQNSMAVLDYMFAQFPKPGRVLVTGCSAGAYAALAYGAKIKEHYSNSTKVVVVPDSGMGAVTADFARTGLGFWGIECAMQACGLRQGLSGLMRKSHTMSSLWKFITSTYPDIAVGHFTSTGDFSQVDHYHEMRLEINASTSRAVSKADWKINVLGLLSSMASYPNFASFVTGGTGHCTGAFSEASLNPEFLPWLNTVMAWNQSMG
jgi:hypothetical protein